MLSNTKSDSDRISNNVVVIKPHRKIDMVSESKSRSIDEIIDTTHPNTYTILTKSDISEIIFNPSNRYKIFIDGLINKIILDDLPNKGTYFLRGCGFNLATAKLNNGKLIFDISNKNRSNKLSEIINITIGDNDENIKNRNDYLRTGRLDSLEILATEPLTDSHIIKLKGLFYIEGEWKKDTKKYIIYPSEKELNLRHLVKEIDFHGNENFELTLRINNDIYGPFTSDKFKNIIKIKFNDWQNVITGIQNNYLSENLNRQVLNCSRLNNISIISNVERLCLTSYRYETYDITSCEKIFV